MKRIDWSNVEFGSIVFQEMREEWSKNVLAEIESAVAVEFDRAQRAAISNLLTVVPWAKHQENFIVVYIFRLDGFVNCGRSVNIFLVPKAVYQHERHLQRLVGKNFVHRLLLPP